MGFCRKLGSAYNGMVQRAKSVPKRVIIAGALATSLATYEAGYYFRGNTNQPESYDQTEQEQVKKPIEQKIEKSEDKKSEGKQKLEQKVETKDKKTLERFPNGDNVRQGSILNSNLGYFVEACDGKTTKTDYLEIGGADTNPRKTYLFFDGERHDDFTEPYISLGNEGNDYKIVVASPKGKTSASVEFLKGNKYGGVEIKDGSKLVVQAKGGSVIIEDRKKQGKQPKVTTRDEFYIVSGNQLLRKNDNKRELKLHDNVKINGVKLKGYLPVALEIEALDYEGRRLVETKDVFSTNDGISILFSKNLSFTSKPQTQVQVQPQVQLTQTESKPNAVGLSDGFIAVDKSVVDDWKRHKALDLLRNNPQYVENWKKTGKDENSLVENVVEGFQFQNRGYDSKGNVLIPKGIFEDWQRFQEEEAKKEEPNLRNKRVMVDAARN